MITKIREGMSGKTVA
jgi:hypothetical protein